MKVTKFSKSVNETLDSSKLYSLEEAFNMLMSFKRESFNESVDVAFNLGVDPRHAEENIRLSINLPHGIGKEVSVLAIVNADKEAEAKDAGADFVGKDEFLDKIKAGKLDARVEKNGILQSSIGKTTFTEDQLKENFNTLQNAVLSAKPNSFKGKYLKSISISSTLGPGIKIGTE
jgi:large subunit ribosomal protein L1